jgi:hypothetical protein
MIDYSSFSRLAWKWKDRWDFSVILSVAAGASAFGALALAGDFLALTAFGFVVAAAAFFAIFNY